MDLIKRHRTSIVLGVVALLAVVALFYPVGGLFEELQGKLQGSVKDYQAIRSLNGQSFPMPIVDLTQEEVARLPIFPTPRVIEEGKRATQRMSEQADRVMQEALKMNQRSPLVATALQGVQGVGQRMFKAAYYSQLDRLKEEMNATALPTPEEIDARAQELYEQAYEPLILMRGNERLPSRTGPDINQQFEMRKARLPEEMGRERAQIYTVYIADETAMDYHPGIPPKEVGLLPEVMDIWAAQLGLWIQEDIASAIVETNNRHGTVKNGRVNVEGAVVKRVQSIDIPKEYITRKGPLAIAPTTGSSIAMPPPTDPSMAGVDQFEDPSAAMQPDYTYTPTGRVCNPLYDVLHFTVTVDADARKFQHFMSELIRNRFITIIGVDLVAVDRNQAQETGFSYGQDQVVQLSLKCEAIFFREWTLKLMPEPVKQLLNITPPDGGPMAYR